MIRLIVVFYFILLGGALTKSVYAETLNRGFAWPLVVSELDPHTTSSDTLFTLISHYLEPLLRMGPEGNIFPGLAEQWEVSEGGKSVTLFLNEKARWVSGKPITAFQVKASIERALSAYGTSDARPMLLPIKGAKQHLQGDYEEPLGIKVIDTHEIRFELVNSNPDFLKVLAFPITSPIPMHQIGNDNRYPDWKTMDTSGPYRWVEKDQHIAGFERNDSYFRDSPYFSKVTFHFSEYQKLIKLFLNQSLDILEFIPAKQIPWLKENIAEKVKTGGNTGAFYLVANHHLFEDKYKGLRAHLVNSVDVERLSRIMTKGLFSTVTGIIPWEDIPLPDSEEHLRQGMLLTKQLGYSAENPLPLCIHMQKSAANETIFNYLQATWGAMNVKLELNYVEYEWLREAEADELCPLIFAGYGSRTQSAEEIILSFIHEEGFFYPWFEGNQEVKQYLKRLSSSPQAALREEVIKEVERFLLNNHLARAIYKTDLIALVHTDKVGNYSQMKTNMFIPLSEYLHPLSTANPQTE